MSEALTVTISVEYDNAGYTDNEVNTLKAALSQVGATRTRGRDVPAATDQVMIDVVLSIFGGLLSAGLYDYLVKPRLERFAETIHDFRQARKASHKQAPILRSVTLSFDDLDVVMYHASNEDLCELPATLELIRHALRNGQLKSFLVQKVEMPLDFWGDEWHVPEYEGIVKRGPSTLWAVSGSYLDLDPRTVYDAARDEKLSPLND
jgi:hypothetical protein